MASNDRTTRAADSRLADLRDNLGDVQDESLLYVPTERFSGDTEYRWVRESVYGERDRSNLQNAMQRERFTPVTVDDIPELAAPLLPGEERQDTLIRNGGLILMQRPRVYGDRAKDAQAKANAEALQAVRRDFSARMDDKNFVVDRTSSVEVTETTPQGRERVTRSRFSE